MKIALDYDDTITRDPAFWRNFAVMARYWGHEIKVVTFRFAENCKPVKEWCDAIGLEYIATEHTGKRKFCADLGWMPDVWVDDSPDFIVM